MTWITPEWKIVAFGVVALLCALLIGLRALRRRGTSESYEARFWIQRAPQLALALNVVLLFAAFEQWPESVPKLFDPLPSSAASPLAWSGVAQVLVGAGMVCGVQKFAGDAARSRGSSPKLQVLNTALMSATAGLSFREAKADREYWGRLVESAVGAHLANTAQAGECELFYWRERNREVDFVVQAGRRLTAIEVKSGRAPQAHRGTAAFVEAFEPHRTLLVGGDGIALDQFLGKPAAHWIGA